MEETITYVIAQEGINNFDRALYEVGCRIKKDFREARAKLIDTEVEFGWSGSGRVFYYRYYFEAKGYKE